jgi:hypothetical protein
MPRTFVQNQQILLQKSDFRSKMLLIFHYISYKFDKISHLKNQIWHWTISIFPDLTSQNQQTWHPWLSTILKCPHWIPFISKKTFSVGFDSHLTQNFTSVFFITWFSDVKKGWVWGSIRKNMYFIKNYKSAFS